MTHLPRTSAERKFWRGVEEIKRLCGEAIAFESRDAYVFHKEIEAGTSNSVTYRCFATEREPPPEEWPLLAGEAIQNLRASLDHVVWAKAKRPSQRTAFPIFTDASAYRVRGAPMLRSVPKATRTIIEDLQPYRDMPVAPAEAALEKLRRLSNLDKHRTLATFATAVQYEAVGTSGPIDLIWHKTATNQPLGSGDTHISTFTVTSAADFDDLQVEPQFAYEVRIEGRPLALLERIAYCVYRALFECETGKPLPPVTPSLF